jgi:hypothetical protein
MQQWQLAYQSRKTWEKNYYSMNSVTYERRGKGCTAVVKKLDLHKCKKGPAPGEHQVNPGSVTTAYREPESGA